MFQLRKILIIKINSEFGRDSIRGTAHIYKSKEELERTEPKHLIKRNTKNPKVVKEQPAAKPTEETTAEKPAEEPKEGKE